MQKSPDKRYENAASALQDLEPYLKSLPDYKPYEILSAYFANPKDSTIKIESKYYNSLYEEARANYYYRNYNKALFQMQIIKSQNYNFEGLNVYIDNIREKKGFLPINESVVKAIDDCKSRLECEPNNIEILLKLAELNLKIGNYYESVYYAKKALQEDENNQTALKIVRSFIRLDDAEVESIRATSGAIVQSADHKKEQQKLTMSIYKKLFVIIVFLGIVIWIMSYFGMINFHTFVKEVSAYDFNAKYDKIAPEALAEIMHKIENSKQEVDKKEAIKKLLYYADLNLEPMESCNVAAMLCNAYISVGNYSLAKESLRRLRRVCPDFALAKGPYKLYAEKMEQAGKYYEAMNAYIEMLLYLKRSDPDYDIIEKKVRELQKIMIGGISMKPEENINR
jgi:tetratricopeptide (TPR) repeat protein